MRPKRFFPWMILLVAGFLAAWSGSPAGAADCKEVYGDSSVRLRVATGSPGELGLLKVLAESFLADRDAALCWVKAGSGKSLALLEDKEVDAVMVHAPAAEKKAVEEGWATQRTLIGSNEFYIVGPSADPAGIAQAETAAEAYRKISEARAVFLSRGDNSGTHKKEMFIWKTAGVEPSGDWYVVTKDFMMATLEKADELGGYFMTDSSTWVAGKKDLSNLKVLFRGDPALVNTYHALCRPDGEIQPLAAELVEFLASEKGQSLIGSYGKDLYGDSMYNDAAYARQYDH